VCQTALTGRRNSVPAASGVVRPVLTWRDLKHRTLKPASSAHRPVQCRFAIFSAHESGGHRTRPVPHKERPVTPWRAHKARAQGLSRTVSLSISQSRPSQALRRRALAPSPSFMRRSPAVLEPSPRQIRPGSFPLPPLLAWIQSREISRVWVSPLFLALKVFDSLREWI